MDLVSKASVNSHVAGLATLQRQADGGEGDIGLQGASAVTGALGQTASANADAIQRVAETIQREEIEGKTVSTHASDQMADRNVSNETVADVIKNGTQYNDSRPQHAGQTIYWKDRIAVAVKGGTITTVMDDARVKRAWTPK
jgi:hypothetical protein